MDQAGVPLIANAVMWRDIKSIDGWDRRGPATRNQQVGIDLMADERKALRGTWCRSADGRRIWSVLMRLWRASWGWFHCYGVG
jgi:hypothetical protein